MSGLLHEDDTNRGGAASGVKVGLRLDFQVWEIMIYGFRCYKGRYRKRKILFSNI